MGGIAVDMNVDCAGRKENLRASSDRSGKRKGLAESVIGIFVETCDIDGLACAGE